LRFFLASTFDDSRFWAVDRPKTIQYHYCKIYRDAATICTVNRTRQAYWLHHLTKSLDIISVRCKVTRSQEEESRRWKCQIYSKDEDA